MKILGIGAFVIVLIAAAVVPTVILLTRSDSPSNVSSSKSMFHMIASIVIMTRLANTSCVGYCQNGGNCTESDVCTCPLTYTGTYCQIRQSNENRKISNGPLCLL
jgi:hypothetical protein